MNNFSSPENEHLDTNSLEVTIFKADEMGSSSAPIELLPPKEYSHPDEIPPVQNSISQVSSTTVEEAIESALHFVEVTTELFYSL